MTGPWDPGQPGWGQRGRPEPDPTRSFPQPGPWTGASPPSGQQGPPPGPPYGGPPPYGPPYGGPPPYGPPSYGPSSYGPPPGPPSGGPTGQLSGWGGGFPPETGGAGRGRGPLIGGLAALLVLVVVLGIVLYVRSSNGSPAPVPAGTSSSTNPAPSSSSAPATPPRPSSAAPSRTTPAPRTTSGSGAASAQDVQAISGLAEQLVNAISAGDQPTLQSIACGTCGATLAQFTTPSDPPLNYDHTEGVSVTGDVGKAAVFAAFGPAAPTPQTMTVQRAGGRWKVCALGKA